MPEARPVKIGPETVATARMLLDRRGVLERENNRAAQGETGNTEYIAGQLAGVNDALAMLWAGVLEQQT